VSRNQGNSHAVSDLCTGLDAAANRGRMKEFLALLVVCGIVAYILCQPSTTPQLERAESRRAVENGPIPNKSSTPKPDDGSIANRWQTTSIFQR
jgi:hypothetical protein